MCDNDSKKKKKWKKHSGNIYGDSANSGTFSLGWRRDLPDIRDLGAENLADPVKEKLIGFQSGPAKAGVAFMLEETPALPAHVDLREFGFFTAVEDQLTLNSCTANAVISLVEYLIKASSGKEQDFSRIFLYKLTRTLMGPSGEGDNGAFIRDTIKALRLFGVPPQKWWPYLVDEFDDEPDAFIYALAQNFQAVQYVRLDRVTESPAQVLNNVKACLADGFPIAFGFYVTPQVFDVSQDDNTVLFPSGPDKIVGGHAVVAAGYDDERQALLIRNSWGADWGDGGYGWLPYEYIEYGLAVDFWTLFETEWLDLQQFDPEA